MEHMNRVAGKPPDGRGANAINAVLGLNHPILGGKRNRTIVEHRQRVTPHPLQNALAANRQLLKRILQCTKARYQVGGAPALLLTSGNTSLLILNQVAHLNDALISRRKVLVPVLVHRSKSSQANRQVVLLRGAWASSRAARSPSLA